ncbi:3-oxoacyl-[acyl-carrier-protein] synthase III C-terminal domain-containing protein [uncultured Ruegeria sp.]|uniref:3-oxoacyl-ACP synthase III family protein n=1 Tax=uncultured Ruegeria sp. TaxID=259304 RepID=UPI002614A90C|nr:3-oxoacyl-[acyl-carrier-protein] synthase III C-terminal domain-containing protein [uncultured Ruegeria sp.]
MSNTIQVSIRGTGHYLPGAPVASETLDAREGLERGYLAHETGVEFRHFAQGIDQIEMAVGAAKRALDQAGLTGDDIDLVISASGVPFQTLPSTAPLVMRELGMADGKAAAFDVNSTCTSFISAFEVASRQVAAGVCRHALIVSSEIASRGLPWEKQPEVAALFGDGAAAAIIGGVSGHEEGIQACLMRSYPSKYEACQIAAGGTRFDYHENPDEFARNTLFQMNGADLFKLTIKHFPDFVDELLEKADWRKDDVDLVVPHQASPHALTHMVRQTGFGAGKIVNLVANIGNQIAASIPTALDHARREGRAEPGTRLLMLGTSAGVSFSGLAIRM